MFLTTQKDTDVLKQTERHMCAYTNRKTKLYLNTPKDTVVLKHT